MSKPHLTARPYVVPKWPPTCENGSSEDCQNLKTAHDTTTGALAVVRTIAELMARKTGQTDSPPERVASGAGLSVPEAVITEVQQQILAVAALGKFCADCPAASICHPVPTPEATS